MRMLSAWLKKFAVLILLGFRIIHEEELVVLVRKFLSRVKRYGELIFTSLLPRYKQEVINYQRWIDQFEPDQKELKNQRARCQALQSAPLISIITPVYNVPEKYLVALLNSLLAQTYPYWELCIANANPNNHHQTRVLQRYAALNNRIKIISLTENFGISENSNRLIEQALGDFVAFLDHDDTLAPFALYEVFAAIEKNPDLDLIYSDHDLLDRNQGRRTQPLFKPDWSPEALLSANYLTHLTVVRRSLVQKMGGFRAEFDGAQDWDLFFRITENTSRIRHIPKILYHWRDSASSTAINQESKPYARQAQFKAIESHLERTGKINPKAFLDPSGYVRVKWDFDDQAKVTILVPTRGAVPMLERCVRSLLEKTHYQNYEILIINNGKKLPHEFPYFQEIAQEKRVRIIHYDREFNYSAVNNFGVDHSESEFIVFLNNDTEVIAPDWLDELVMWASQPEIGAVGAKLLRPNGRIQHAGIIVGLTGFAGHIFGDQLEKSWTWFGSTEWYRNYQAVTAACLITRRDVYNKVGRLSEYFILCGNDVDFGIRVNQAGWRVVYNPFVRLTHLEAATRENAIPAQDFVVSYQKFFEILETGDPYYNSNLSYWTLSPALRTSDEPAPINFAFNYSQKMEKTE